MNAECKNTISWETAYSSRVFFIFRQTQLTDQIAASTAYHQEFQVTYNLYLL